MFKNEKEDYNDYNSGSEDTVIGSSIKIEGDLSSNGSIVIEGEVIGQVKTEKNLRVGDKAKVQANIEAGDAYISGKVEGNINAREKLELASSAEVTGDVTAKTLVIAAGALLNGKCSMSERGGIRKEESAESNE